MASVGRYSHVLGGRALSAIFQALALLLVARHTAPFEFGLFSVLLAAISPVIYLADLGTQSLGIRERARQETCHEALRTMYLQRVLSSILCVVALAVILVAVVVGALPFWAPMVPVVILVEKEIWGLLGIALSDGRSLVQLLLLPTMRLVSLALTGVGIWLGMVEPITVYLMSVLLSGGAGLVILGASLPRYQRPAKESVRQKIRSGLAFWAAVLSHQIRSADVALVGLVSSPYEAGLYALPARVSGPVRLAATSLSSVALPLAARGDLYQLKKLNRQMLYITLLSSVLLLSVIVGAESMIHLLVGERYVEAVSALRLISLGLMLNIPGSYMSGVLQGVGRQNFVGKLGIYLAILAVIAVAAGSLIYGATGAAFGMLLVYLTQFIVVLREVRRWRREVRW